MMKAARIILLGCAVAPATCIAGGTVGLSDIDPLLRQRPGLRNFLTISVDLNDTVMAAVRFGPQFEHLSGARMGPYMIEARPKGLHATLNRSIVNWALSPIPLSAWSSPIPRFPLPVCRR
jgi:hypothetical protein